MADIYYKDIESSLFKVKTCEGWFIQANTIEDALGLANKRGEYKLEDLEQIGTCVTILGTSPKYEDVINMRDQLERAWALLGHEDAALTLCGVSHSADKKEPHGTIIKKGCPECGSDISDGTATGWQVCQNPKCQAML